MSLSRYVKICSSEKSTRKRDGNSVCVVTLLQSSLRLRRLRHVSELEVWTWPKRLFRVFQIRWYWSKKEVFPSECHHFITSKSHANFPADERKKQQLFFRFKQASFISSAVPFLGFCLGFDYCDWSKCLINLRAHFWWIVDVNKQASDFTHA